MSKSPLNLLQHLLPAYLSVLVLLLAGAIAACGADPVPAATPTATIPPTPTPSPTPTPAPVMVTFWQFDASSTGQDFIDELSSSEAACLEDSLGALYPTLLTAPLMETVGALGLEGSGPNPLAACLTPGNQASANLSMFALSAGGFSAATQDCISGLLTQDPSLLDALSDPAGLANSPAALQFLACLTPEEAAALTPSEEGPPPDTEGLTCIMKELADDPEGERIIAVLSGADPSGAGLTIEESAVLGVAVEACGVETGFTFPPSPPDGSSGS